MLRKHAVLRPNEHAPLAQEGLGRELQVAQVMLDPNLVVPGGADADEHDLGSRVHAEISERFGTPLLISSETARASPWSWRSRRSNHCWISPRSRAGAEAFAAAVRTS